MGTISDKLMRIINTKEDIRQALISKGYDVPTSIPFKEYAKMILDLPCKVDSFPDIEGIVARYSASGLTNEQMAANPVWADKTGNDHDLQMKNFAWAGMSGVGGYKLNWGDSSIWANYITQGTFGTGEVTDNTIHITSAKTNNALFETRASLKSVEYKVLIKGLTDDIYLRYGVFNDGKELWTEIKNDGIYTLPSYDYDSRYNMKWKVMSQTYPIDCDITIEQLPLYPGALVFDGVDDYGVCDNFPILTKEKGYTVVALRQWLSPETKIINEVLLGNFKNNPIWTNVNLAAFQFEVKYNISKIVQTNSFGIGNNITLNNNHLFSYQISNSYNGSILRIGNGDGGNFFTVGCGGDQFYSNAAIWELVFLDHDATEEELTKIKDYFIKTYPWLFPDQSWTVVGKTNEDEDRATIANITGNGNDLVLSNFAFSGNSGYGSYVCNFNDTSTWIYYSYNGTIEITSSTIHVTEAKTARPFFEKNASSGGYNKVKIKVTGIKDGEILKFMSDEDRDNTINIEKDGIYSLPGSDKLYYGFRLSNSTNTYPFNCDITIEQIPEYEGYLVTDGVDDKAASKQFKFGENFTVILDFKFPVKKISYCGFDLSSKVRIQNLQGSGVNVVLKGNKTLIPSNVVRAVTSEGKVYDENWNEYNIVPGNISSNYTTVNLGFDGSNQFAESATKLAGIYSSALSKDDCIKAYNYLQTLKAK